MNMKSIAVEELYETSRDYDRLFELLESGHRIICIIDYRFHSESKKAPASRDICIARKNNYEINVSARGISYLCIFNEMFDRKELFKAACASDNLVWILPNNGDLQK